MLSQVLSAPKTAGGLLSLTQTYVRKNPLKFIDPNGQNACGTDDDTNCRVDITYESRSTDKNGKYNDQHADIKGNEDYNAVGTVTVNGEVAGGFLARTVPSDSKKYASSANGTYSATLEPKHGAAGQPAIRLQPTNYIPTVGPNPTRSDGEAIATGILIHKAGTESADYPLGFTGMFAGNTRGVSEGCTLISTPSYPGFLEATGIRPKAGAPQQHFTVVYRAKENKVP